MAGVRGPAMRVAIVGSRPPKERPGTWDNDVINRIERILDDLPKGSTVVSGGAAGVDSLAAFCARRKGFGVVEYLPDWEQFGKSAGYRRNAEIVAAVDVVYALWNGRSKGTQSTIDMAKRAGKHVRIIDIR